jgi:very-short-patch-repair endonuclease
LRNRQLSGVKFRRQYPIGKYILDFYAPEYRLGIEADGGQHYEDDVREKDDIREKELSMVGVEIIRFNDGEILRNIEGVCESILQKLKKEVKYPLTSVLSPTGRGRNNLIEKNDFNEKTDSKHP